MYVSVSRLEDTSEEMGVDVEYFKVDVRKSEIGYMGSHASGYGPNIWSPVNIIIRLIFGIDVFIPAVFFFAIPVSVVG
jgi:hypothetical protein